MAGTKKICVDLVEGWFDRDGDGCEKYVNHEWCTSTGGYGPNWGSPGETFSTFSVDGIGAAAACCGCGGGIDNAIDNSIKTTVDVAMCQDAVGWLDSDGSSCSNYVSRGWCTSSGQRGANWGSSSIHFSDFSSAGLDASTACCGCGGNGTKSITVRSTTAPSQSTVPVSKPAGNQDTNTSTPLPANDSSADAPTIGWVTVAPGAEKSSQDSSTGEKRTLAIVAISILVCFVLVTTFMFILAKRYRLLRVMEHDGDGKNISKLWKAAGNEFRSGEQGNSGRLMGIEEDMEETFRNSALVGAPVPQTGDVTYAPKTQLSLYQRGSPSIPVPLRPGGNNDVYHTRATAQDQRPRRQHQLQTDLSQSEADASTAASQRAQSVRYHLGNPPPVPSARAPGIYEEEPTYEFANNQGGSFGQFPITSPTNNEPLYSFAQDAGGPTSQMSPPATVIHHHHYPAVGENTYETASGQHLAYPVALNQDGGVNFRSPIYEEHTSDNYALAAQSRPTGHSSWGQQEEHMYGVVPERLGQARRAGRAARDEPLYERMDSAASTEYAENFPLSPRQPAPGRIKGHYDKLNNHRSPEIYGQATRGGRDGLQSMGMSPFTSPLSPIRTNFEPVYVAPSTGLDEPTYEMIDLKRNMRSPVPNTPVQVTDMGVLDGHAISAIAASHDGFGFPVETPRSPRQHPISSPPPRYSLTGTGLLAGMHSPQHAQPGGFPRNISGGGESDWDGQSAIGDENFYDCTTVPSETQSAPGGDGPIRQAHNDPRVRTIRQDMQDLMSQLENLGITNENVSVVQSPT